jgi:hypothetical protein
MCSLLLHPSLLLILRNVCFCIHLSCSSLSGKCNVYLVPCPGLMSLASPQRPQLPRCSCRQLHASIGRGTLFQGIYHLIAAPNIFNPNSLHIRHISESFWPLGPYTEIKKRLLRAPLILICAPRVLFLCTALMLG